MTRASGVLMHISSLYGKYSVGSFGDEAKEFIDFLEKSGFSYWQVLPFCMPDPYYSPYQSYSAFAGNPWFIDLPQLHAQGLLTDKELAESEQCDKYSCEFERLEKERLKLLKKAASRVKDTEPIDEFMSQEPQLENFCRFMALKESNNNLPWFEWTNTEYSAEVEFMWRFIQ